MRRASSRLSGGVAACVLAVAACGSSGQGPASPSGSGNGSGSQQTCRHLATVSTAVTTAVGFQSTTQQTCVVAQSPVRSTCTASYSDTAGGSTTATTVTTYASIADLVAEVRVVPPLFKGASGTASASGNGGSSSTSTTYSYDGQGRLTRQVSTGTSGTITSTYTQWDDAGRPTRARDEGPGFGNTRIITYDDAARMRTTNSVVDGQGVAVVTIESFDANGNPTGQSVFGQAGSSVSTVITTSQTQQICG